MVNIPISADASQVVNAFAQVQEAIRRSGQEAKAFRDLDLSHPELAGFAQDLGRMQKQLEDLMRVSQGETARAARRVFGAPDTVNPFAFSAHGDTWERMYSDPAERSGLRGRVEAYITRGTSFAPPTSLPPPPPGAPPPPPRWRHDDGDDGGGWGGGGGMFSSGLGMLKRGGLFALGMAGVGTIGGTIHKAYSGATEEAMGNEQLFRRMPGLAEDFDTLRESVRKASEGMGITYQEAQRLAGMFTRITGYPGGAENSGGENARAWTHLSAGFGRSAGMDAATSMALFARQGSLFAMKGGDFAALVADAAQKASQTGNIEKVMESLVRYQETTARILVSSTGNVGAYAAMWAGMNASGKPGMRGDGATALLGTIDQTLRAGGGGGHAGQALMYRALATHGVTNAYEMAYLQEGGMFQELPDKTLLYDAVREQVSQYGDPRKRQMAMSIITGTTMRDAEAMEGVRPADTNGTVKALKKYGLDPNKLDPTAFVDIAKYLDSTPDQQRAYLAKRNDLGLSEPEKQALGGASPDQVRELGVRSIAAHGMRKTEASELVDGQVKMVDGLTALGAKLITPLTAIQNILGNIFSAVDTVAKFFSTGSQSGGGGLPFMGADVPAAGLMTIAYQMAARGSGGGIRLAGGFGNGMGGPVNMAGSIPIGDRAAILARATKGTMIPPELLDAVFSQESGWRPDIQRQGGSDLGLGQITDSTAADPGFGMEPISRADRMNPDKAASWTARYLEARGRALGLTKPEDWRDPAKVARALRAYNGGGDKAYPEHVFRHMRSPQRAGQAGSATKVQASFEPLRVIHEDRSGNVLREEALAVSPIRSPMAYGLA